MLSPIDSKLQLHTLSPSLALPFSLPAPAANLCSEKRTGVGPRADVVTVADSAAV